MIDNLFGENKADQLIRSYLCYLSILLKHSNVQGAVNQADFISP